MRRLVPPCLLLLAASCADDERGGPGEGPQVADACALAQQLLFEQLDDLKSVAPACEVDADCVTVPTRVEARSAQLHLCGEVLHREVAVRWDPDSVADAVDARTSSETQCAIEASCAQFHPACQQSRCVTVLD